MRNLLSRRWKPLVGALAVVAFGAVLVTGLLARSDEFPEATLGVRGPLPELAGTDPVSGRRVSTADFAGRPLVVNMWASWCEGCRVEAPDIQRFVADRPDIAFLGLDVTDTDAAARDFVRSYGWTHPSIADPSGELANMLNLQGLPTTVYVWPDGRIAATDLGEINYERLQSVGNALAAGAPESGGPDSDEL